MVSDDPLPPGHVTPLLPLKWPIHVAFSHNSATDPDRRIKFGSQYVYMDFYTNITFKVQKGRGLGHQSRHPLTMVEKQTMMAKLAMRMRGVT